MAVGALYRRLERLPILMQAEAEETRLIWKCNDFLTAKK